MALQENRLDRYWAESGYDQLILARFYAILNDDRKFRGQIERLLTDVPVNIELDKGMTYHSILKMTRRQLWTLLYSAGYLTRRMVESNHLCDVGNGSATDSPDDSESEGNNDSGPSSGDLKSYLSAQIPNHEIRSLFREWLRDHLMNIVDRSGKGPVCINFFQNMVSGSMAVFAKKFMKMIWTTLPPPFLGSKECVYQAYVCGFFTVASQLAFSALDSDPEGSSLDVEGSSGIGRFDFSMHYRNEAVIHEYKRIVMSKQDKKSGYGDLQRERLTKSAKEGLEEIQIKGYRAQLRDDVTKLREYGIAFLGPYCAIIGHSLERAPGGQWKIAQSYGAERNERHRDKLYTMSDTS